LQLTRHALEYTPGRGGEVSGTIRAKFAAAQSGLRPRFFGVLALRTLAAPPADLSKSAFRAFDPSH